jgi:hypothetical protein
MVLQGGSEKKGARFCAKGYSGKSELLFRSVYNRGQKQSSIAFTFKTKQKVSKKLFS